MQKIYTDGTYLKNNETWHKEDSPYKANWIRRIIEKNSLNLNTICEIGCGSGEVLKKLSGQSKKNIKFSGYEISPQAFEICKQKEGVNLNFFLKDLLKEDKFFDALLIIDVIEHIDDYFNFLRQIKTKAKYKIFHIPLDLSILNILRVNSLSLKRKEVGHIHYFTKEIALESIKASGYKIIDCFYTNVSSGLPNQSFKSKLLKLPRNFLYLINKDFAVKALGGYSLMVLAE